MKDNKLYLGKYSDGSEKFLYDMNDFTTHSIVFGMTGSGKTGLCIDILEEAIDEDIPIIAIDPKGDLTNLALMFPDFNYKDFLKWVTPSSSESLSSEEYAKSQAEFWKKGLQEWDINSNHIKNLKNKTDLRIFTPGSSSGLRVSILDSFKKPEGEFEENEEEFVEKIKNSVSALLSLIDVDNDPLNSKEHILVSNIIEYYWRNNKDLTIEDLIINIQKPPIKKLGVFEVNQLINPKERMELSFKLNNIVASPSFRFWSTGVSISANSFFNIENNKIPVNIFYIAHLSENERMFFVTLLLNEVLDWIRKQSGSGNLKYILYMDEIFGYLPPYPKNPPSKNSLLLLLKQARAFGLGVILATQNPKDIDYKGLTNIGTWFIGRLQAEGDRERVMEGLRGVGTEIKNLTNEMIGLEKREFIVKNVHESDIKKMKTRWAISYLAGPLTREQIKEIVKEQKFKIKISKRIEDSEEQEEKSIDKKHLLPYPPTIELPMEIYYENMKSKGFYSPFVYFKGDIIFDDNKVGLYIKKKFYVKVPLSERLNFSKAVFSEKEFVFEDEPDDNIKEYEPIDFKMNFTFLKSAQRDLKDYLFANLSLNLFRNKELNLISEIDETEEAFKLRCRGIADRLTDKEVEKLKDKYMKKIDKLEDKIDREKVRLERLQLDYKAKKNEEWISIGESVLGFVLGSKSRRALSSAARKRRMTSSTAERIKEKELKVEQLKEELELIKNEMEDEIAEIEDKYLDLADNIEEFVVRLEKNDIIVSLTAFLWVIT